MTPLLQIFSVKREIAVNRFPVFEVGLKIKGIVKLQMKPSAVNALGPALMKMKARLKIIQTR